MNHPALPSTHRPTVFSTYSALFSSWGPALRWTLVVSTLLTAGAARSLGQESAQESTGTKNISIYYLEIVTPEVEATCKVLEETHGIEFSAPVPEFGHARTAALSDGGQIAVRAPLQPQEKPVVRPYRLVENIESAVETAVAEGGEVMMPPTAIPGRGTFAIYFHGGIEHGLWQN